MSQISPPIRIVLAVAVLFLAAWMTVLKPKSDVAAPPAATTATKPGNLATGKDAVSAPGKLVQKARDDANTASAQEQARAAGEDVPATPSSTGAATTTQGAAATAQPPAAVAATLAGVPAPVAKAILKQKVIVLGFVSEDSAVDRSVRRSLAKVDRWDGRVFVKAVPLSQVGKYSRVTIGAKVDQSPSVVVVDRTLKATTIAGYTDRVAIDQAVVDALRASGGLFTSAYMRHVNAACTHFGSGFYSIAQPTNPAQVQPYVARHAANLGAFAAELRGIKAPARYAGFKKNLVADIVALRVAVKDWSQAMGKHPSVARILSTTSTAVKRAAPLDKRIDARLTKHHLISCS